LRLRAGIPSLLSLLSWFAFVFVFVLVLVPMVVAVAVDVVAPVATREERVPFPTPFPLGFPLPFSSGLTFARPFPLPFAVKLKEEADFTFSSHIRVTASFRSRESSTMNSIPVASSTPAPWVPPSPCVSPWDLPWL